MLRQILCLPSSNPGAALGGLAAATQAAVHSSNGCVHRLNHQQIGHLASQESGTEDISSSSSSSSSSSASSALHHIQHNHRQQCTADAATRDQPQQHCNVNSRNTIYSWQQCRSQTISVASAAALPTCHPHLPLQQQQQAFWPQQTRQTCWHAPQLCHQRQQVLLQGPAACWLVGQAWRGIQHAKKPLPKGKRPPGQPKSKPEVKKPQMRRNTQITAPVVMVVMPDGTKQEMGLSAALDAAAALGLDLVEVNPRGQPPVARVMDWGKFAYEQQQKADAADKLRRQQQKLMTPKEMQFSARIADHDLEVKMRKVAGWLDLGYRVQLVVKHGREEEAAAAEALDYLLARVQADYNVEAGAQQQQRRAISRLVKPLGAPGEAAKNKADEAEG